MILYIDIEHIRVKELYANLWEKHLSRTLDIKYRLEEVGQEECLILRYEKLSHERLSKLKPKAVLVSGNMTEFQHYSENDLAGLRQTFLNARQPILGFCGGAQMMAETFGSTAAAIDADGVGDMLDENWKERIHEFGFTPVRKLKEHALLEGLKDEFEVMEMHYWEIKELPEGFEQLAETDVTPLQIISHKTLPLYGTQFHPEAWDSNHTDGRTFLENFFKLANQQQ